MDDNQDLQRKNPDLYEEVLISESLDPYEALLNHSKSTKKSPIDITKKISSHTPINSSHTDPDSPNL